MLTGESASRCRRQISALQPRALSRSTEIWDTAGQDAGAGAVPVAQNTPAYYRGVVACYDATDAESYVHVPGWYTQLTMMGERGSTVGLCGSKLDLATAAACPRLMRCLFAAAQGLAVFR